MAGPESAMWDDEVQLSSEACVRILIACKGDKQLQNRKILWTYFSKGKRVGPA